MTLCPTPAATCFSAGREGMTLESGCQAKNPTPTPTLVWEFPEDFWGNRPCSATRPPHTPETHTTCLGAAVSAGELRTCRACLSYCSHSASPTLASTASPPCYPPHTCKSRKTRGSRIPLAKRQHLYVSLALCSMMSPPFLVTKREFPFPGYQVGSWYLLGYLKFPGFGEQSQKRPQFPG